MTCGIALHFCTTLSHATFIRSWQNFPHPKFRGALFLLTFKGQEHRNYLELFVEFGCRYGLIVLRESTNHVEQIR